jgi:hypothetical protein
MIPKFYLIYLNKNYKFLFLFVFILLFRFVFADGIDTVREGAMKILNNIINFAFSVLMILASLFLVILGILLIVSGKEKYHILGQEVDARRAFLYLVSGIVLLILSFFLPNIIKNFIENSTQ